MTCHGLSHVLLEYKKSIEIKGWSYKNKIKVFSELYFYLMSALAVSQNKITIFTNHFLRGNFCNFIMQKSRKSSFLMKRGEKI